MDVMDNTVRGILFLLAFVCFLVGVLANSDRSDIPYGAAWIAAGLALFVVPFCWDAFALS